jgi:hypothetical protein
MLEVGDEAFAAVADRLRLPSAAIAKLLICPLLDAIRKAPSGVTANDMPWQLSSVKPLGNGDPGTGVKTPVVGAIENALIVRSRELLTYSRFFVPLTTMRSSAGHEEVAPLPPVRNGDPGTAINVPAAVTENPDTLFALVWSLT